jgi:hypothetical protein
MKMKLWTTYNDTKFETSTDVDEQNTLSITYYRNLFRSRIHERKISLRFLGIILRVLRLDVSIYCTIFTIQTSIKPLFPKNSGSDRANTYPVPEIVPNPYFFFFFSKSQRLRKFFNAYFRRKKCLLSPLRTFLPKHFMIYFGNLLFPQFFKKPLMVAVITVSE